MRPSNVRILMIILQQMRQFNNNIIIIGSRGLVRKLYYCACDKNIIVNEPNYILQYRKE